MIDVLISAHHRLIIVPMKSAYPLLPEHSPLPYFPQFAFNIAFQLILAG